MNDIVNNCENKNLSSITRKKTTSNELEIGKAGEHLTCCDLILKGYNAFLADQGLPYDVVVDDGSKLWKVQVRTTLTLFNVDNRLRYRFHNRKGRCGQGSRDISPKLVDFYAFVAVDINSVAYMTSAQLENKRGYILQTVDFKSRLIDYSFPSRKTDGYVQAVRGKYFQDFMTFPIDKI